MFRTVRVIAFVLSIVCLAVIVYLSLARDVSMPEHIPGEDKGAHFLAYTALGFFLLFCFYNAVYHRIIVSNLMPVLGAASLASLCGYAIELCQPHFGRFFEVADIVADGLGSLTGAVIGLFCVFFMCRIERRRRHR